MEKYVVLEKAVGETPLSCAEAWRAMQSPAFDGVPMAYAGRLDPMASGKLLILLGEECKQQEQYHGLDKEYVFSVLFGISSDTHDVLGRLTAEKDTPIDWSMVEAVTAGLVGDVALPYPLFSSKTIEGKPLHTWTLEGRLDEIEIPTNESTVYMLELTKLETMERAAVATAAREKIDTIPPVTDLRKAIGNDFRRADVRADWEGVKTDDSLPSEYTIAHFRCIASSGTYMRSLAHLIGQQLGSGGLAWHIHRTKIGDFDPNTKNWTREF